MLKLLKRWLGWEADSGPFDFGALQISRGRPAQGPPAPAKPQAPAARKAAPPAPPAPPAPAESKPKAKTRAPMDVLNNPSLTLDKPSADGFDPYNTGAFNRSTSWERIGRQKKR
jgi:hypothetical protein